MIKLANILLESEGPAPKKIPFEICWHLSEEKRSTFPDYGFHIGTELQSLDRGLQMLGDEMVDDPDNTVFYLHLSLIHISEPTRPY